VEDIFQKMQPPLKPEEMEALKTPQMIPAVDTASPFATDPSAFDSTVLDAQDTADAEVERQLAQDNYSYSQFFSDIAGTEWATTQWLLEGGVDADVDWDLTPQHLERWKKEVPPHLQDRIDDEEIMSEQMFNDSITRLQKEDEATSRLATASGWGQGGRMVLGALDPVEIGASIAAEIGTFGLATPALAAKWGWKAKNLRLLTGGTSNAALGVAFNASRDKDDSMSWADYGMGMAIDFTVGAIAGRLSNDWLPIGTKQKADLKLPKTAIMQQVEQQQKDLDALREYGESITAPPESTVGAAQVPNTEVIRPSITTAPELKDADVPKSAAPTPRIDVVGQGATSDDPMERLIMPYLGEDAVGKPKGEGTTPISTTEWARQKHSAQEALWKQTLLPNYREWAKEQGWGWWRRKWTAYEDYEKFSKQVYDFIEDERPNAAQFYDPKIVKTGEKARTILADYAKLYNNPGLEDGALMRSINGAERLKPDPFYFPKVADREAIDDLTSKFGFQAIRGAVREAVEDAMQVQGYQIKPELLDKVADGWLTNISKAGYGDEDGLASILAGRSKSRMYEVLNAAGIDEDTVKEIVQAMDAKDASTPRLKSRTPINYRKTVQLQNKRTGQMEDFSPLDFFSKDVDHVMMAYSRRAAGEVAFGRLRIKDPTRTDGGLWIDGITSKAEFDAKMKAAVADSYQKRGGGDDARSAAKLAQKRLDYLYKATLGLPQHDMDPRIVKTLRRIRDYNFLRLMGNMGITQAIELGRIFSMTGVRAAMDNMPSLKRIIEEGTGDTILSNKMARELEMWGITENDYWIGGSKYRYQEELVGEGQQKSRFSDLGEKYDNLVNKGKEVLAYSSFQRPIHSRQQQWAAKAATQWFADNARDAKRFMKFKDRLADMGLDEADMKAIRKEIVKWADSPDPDKRKITAMHFDKWDAEVRSKFLTSLRRYTNRIVQVNEPGNLPMWFSNPVAQTFLQFRTFSFASYPKATQWNLKHRDQQAAMVFVGDVAFGAATFALMAHARSLTRDDRDEYLEKNLSMTNLAAMGFARAGVASLAPILIDSALAFTPSGPMFMGSRASGTASDAWGGSAPVDLWNGIAGGSAAFMDSVWSDRELSQQEMRGIGRSLPFGNSIGAAQFLESLISDRPRMAPRKDQ
jgi:hypothetical protein